LITKTIKMSNQGLRVLAFAFGKSQDDLTFIGLVGMIDPLREGMQESVQTLLGGKYFISFLILYWGSCLISFFLFPFSFCFSFVFFSFSY